MYIDSTICNIGRGKLMFDELQDVDEQLIGNTEIKPYGILITISAREGIMHTNHISLVNNNFFYYVKIYRGSIPLHLYFEINSTGNVIRVLKETVGTLPELFISPTSLCLEK
jgi:hypothetical protein